MEEHRVKGKCVDIFPGLRIVLLRRELLVLFQSVREKIIPWIL
jgi:hypothetical protein